MAKEKEKPALSYRSAPVSVRADGSPETLDEKTRSVEVIMSTENPARVYDWDRGVISEVLLMSGARVPKSRQVVLLDTHSRYDTASVIGSVRGIEITDGVMKGRSFFSSAPEAESPWIKTKEGHLTDFSIGYKAEETVWIDAGKTEVINGKAYSGPLQVTTKWALKELSSVPIGADEDAKSRSIINDTNTIKKESNIMDEKIRKMLEGKGLPVTATEEEAVAFMGRMEVPKEPEKKEVPPDLDKIRNEATGVERTRIREIDALLTQYGCQDMARDLIIGRDGKVPTIEEAQKAVLDEVFKRSKEQNPGFSGVKLGADEKDKFRAAASDSLLMRADIKVATPAPGAHELRGYTLVEMARECLRVSGRDHRGNTKDMVGRALTSSDFPNILANLATKSMQLAWDSMSETWSVWCGVGSVSDFKTYYDNALSEHDDLEEVKDSGEIKSGSFSEKTPETYKAATYAKKFKITRVMIINDDLGALTEMPAKRAEAASRKVGDVAYAVLTANGNMGDGYAIFSNTYHANYAPSGFVGAPGIANLAEGIRAMGVQKDIKGKRRLNISPKFFLAPKALEGTSEVLFKSDKYVDPNTIATDSSLAATRANPYSGAYFTRVYEPRLDDVSTTAWYLAGPKGKTIKVVFLNGVQAPMMEMIQPGFTIEGFEYAVSIDVGAYAVDYRGLYGNVGA